MTDPRPMCAVCQRRVDSIEEERDEATRVTMFVARCHGEMQIVTLPDHQLVTGSIAGMTPAFTASPRLVS